MKKLLLETSFSKIYMLVVVLVSLLIMGSYFSYAMFTVTKEKSNAISIVTGNLTYKLEVDGEESDKLVVPSNTIKEFIVTLSNPNNRLARFNFYYLGSLPSNVDAGYMESEGYNTPPEKEGINLEKSGASSSSNTYIIRVANKTNNNVTIDLGVSVGLDYNDLVLPDNGHLFDKYNLSFIDKILDDNTVQNTKNKMFNYAGNGNYVRIYENQEIIENDPNQITTGVYSAEDEDGTSYYFRGNVNNNNVQFGEYVNDYYVYQALEEGSLYPLYFQSLETCQEYNSNCSEDNKVKIASKGDKMYWKIIRVNGDGSLRLIYNGTSPSPTSQELSTSYVIGVTPYSLTSNDVKLAGYTYDNGTDSFIKKQIDTWYNNTLGNSDYDSQVVEGRFCSDSSGYKPSSDYGFDRPYNVFISYNRLHQRIGPGNDNSPSLKCPETTESYGGSYKLKAGLITADELVFAGGNLQVPSDDYLTATSTSEYRYWSMTPADFRDNRVTMWDIQDMVHIQFATVPQGIRPVINVLIPNPLDTLGDGTVDNPYHFD